MRKKRNKTKNRITNINQVRQSQAMDAFQNVLTRSGFGMPNPLEATTYPLTRFTQDWQKITALYRSHWVVQRIINVIPQDMVKNGYDIQSDLSPEQLKAVQATIRRTQLRMNVLNGLYWGRLYGGAAGIILLDGEGDKMEEPIDLDAVLPHSFKGLLIVDRWSGITPESELVTDINDPEFGLPKYYNISLSETGQATRIHHSRICRFIGREMPYLEKLAENYWGTSEMEHVIDELQKRDNVSWNVALLTFMANIRVVKMEGMEEILALGDRDAQQQLYNTVEGMNMLLNNNALQVLGSKDDYQQHQYTFSGLGDVYDRFMMDVSGASGIPVTKLFGRSPAGLNATGDADMQNYYDTVESYQESQLRPVLDKLLPIIFMSELGAVPDDFDYVFNPVRRSGEDEKQDLGSKQTTAVTEAFTSGLISQKTALQELQQSSKRTGMWTNITDDDIAGADDTVGAMGEEPVPSMLTTDTDFKEDDHPRDEDGKFSSGSSSSSNAEAENKKDPDLPEGLKTELGEKFTGYKGREAIDKLLEEKHGYVENAFESPQLPAPISLAWGNDMYGLQHIIKRRLEQNISEDKLNEFLHNIDTVLKNGESMEANRGNIEIFYGKQSVVVAPSFSDSGFHFIVTSFRSKRKSKK